MKKDVVVDIQDWIQAPGVHLPDPLLENTDEKEEGGTALSNTQLYSHGPRICAAGEKANGWSKPAYTRSSCLGSEDIRYPVGRHGTEGSPSPAGIPCLKVTILRAALPASIPDWKQHRTEHSPGCNAHLHPPHLPSHIKANQTASQRPILFIQFCMYGDTGPSPTHHCMYHSGE